MPSKELSLDQLNLNNLQEHNDLYEAVVFDLMFAWLYEMRF